MDRRGFIAAALASGAIFALPPAPDPLAAAVQDVERSAKSVHPEVGNYYLAPTGEPYIELCNGYIRPEGAPAFRCGTAEEAIAAWRNGVLAYVSQRGGALYWRCRPVLDRYDNGYVVYSRLLVSHKRPVQPARLA